MRIRQFFYPGALGVLCGIAGCAASGQAPEQRPIQAFARSEGLTDDIRVRTTYSLPEFDFREFRVDYRGPEGKEWFRIGVEVAGHAGWTKPACWIYPDILQLLATMLDVNHDPRLPPQDTPSIHTIRQRARVIMRGALSGGGGESPRAGHAQGGPPRGMGQVRRGRVVNCA